MQMNPLGRTGLKVSELCLGSITWGTQNSEAEGHAQIDHALAQDINFIDTAEMYPVNPIRPETTGRTEEIIGTWNAANPNRRGSYILATKHSGEGNDFVRDGAPISSASIPGTVEGSLRRLQTDYIDLYQFHWPNRGSYMFRKNWTYDPSGQDKASVLGDMEDCLEALQMQVEKGNIRHFGLSNESAWGLTTLQFIHTSQSLCILAKPARDRRMVRRPALKREHRDRRAFRTPFFRRVARQGVLLLPRLKRPST